MEFVESLYGPMVQGEKSDPPVGTGRGLKLRASKAAEQGRSEVPGGLFSAVVDVADDVLS